MTTALVYHAAARGIEVRKVESTLEGDLDIRGLLGLSEYVRRGYQQIRMKFKTDVDGTPRGARGALPDGSEVLAGVRHRHEPGAGVGQAGRVTHPSLRSARGWSILGSATGRAARRQVAGKGRR